MSYYVTNENSVLNINNAHLKVSGNIQTDVMKLGAIEFAPPASDVPGTVNFTNVTTGVTTSSNLNVGGTLMLGAVEVVGTPTNTANLHDVVNLGNVTSNTVQFTNATTSLVASGNVVVTGNVTADHFVGDGSNITGISSTLQAITDSGNVTSNTVQFSNAITGFVTTANIEVGTANLFVDTSSSRVGIGGNNPDGKLHVFTSSGDANSTDNALFIGGPENCTGIPNLRLGCHQTPNYAWMQSHCSSALCLNPLGGTNVGIWTSSPNTTLHVKNETDSSGTGDAYISGKTKKPTECLRLQGKYHNTGSGALLRFTNQHNSGTFPNTGEYNLAGIAGYDHDNSWGGGLAFYTSPGSGTGGDNLTHRMSIDQSGNVGIGTSSPPARFTIRQSSGRYENGSGLRFIQPSGTNRWDIGCVASNDANYAWAYNGSAKGYLQHTHGNSVLNFTGQHRTFIKDTPFAQAENLEGLIVSADQNKYIKMSGGIEAGSNAITVNESLPLVSLSVTTKDKKCFGVISTSEDPEKREEEYGNWVSVSEKEKGDTRVYINSVGEGAIWVANIGGSLESGDYITTSTVKGYGQKQDDDILHNYTVAKITMDCNFDPVTQPVQMIKKDEDGENVLDEHGQIQWEDHPTESEKAYKIRYLDASGVETDEANAVHKAAFVGCTYHCG